MSRNYLKLMSPHDLTPTTYSSTVEALSPGIMLPRKLFLNLSLSTSPSLRKLAEMALVNYRNTLPKPGYTYANIFRPCFTKEQDDVREVKSWLDSIPASASDTDFLKTFLNFYARRQATKPRQKAIVFLLRSILLVELKARTVEYYWVCSDGLFTQHGERAKRVVSLTEKSQRLQREAFVLRTLETMSSERADHSIRAGSGFASR